MQILRTCRHLERVGSRLPSHRGPTVLLRPAIVLPEIPRSPLDNQIRCATLDANRVVGGRPLLWEGRRTGNPVRFRDGPRRCNRVFERFVQSPSHCRVRHAGPVAGRTTRRPDEPNSEVRRPTNAVHVVLCAGSGRESVDLSGTRSSSASCDVLVCPAVRARNRLGASRRLGSGSVCALLACEARKGGEQSDIH